MAFVITPYSSDESKTPFADLTPMQKQGVQRRMESILADSFQTDENRKGPRFRQRIQTQAEVKRRGMIMVRWFRRMRGDEGYSVQKALDLLPGAIRTELDGGVYNPPPKNRLWTPEGVIQ